MTHTAQHTPGPWIIRSEGSPIDMGDRSLGICAPSAANKFGEYDALAILPEGNKANARLIAAAPDLLVNGKAAIAALSQPVQETPVAGTIEELRVQVAILRADARAARNYLNAAIAKAEGHA